MANITFFAPDTDAFVDSVVKHIAEYEAMSNDTVRLRIIGSDEYFSNQIQGYLAEEGGADVYMSGPVLLWEHVNKGFVEDLDAYISSEEEKADYADFIPNLIRANRWSGKFGDPLGNGPLLGLPVNCESYNMAYNRDVFEELKLPLPRTWDEYFETAKIIAEKAEGVCGFAQRGTTSWHTVYTGFATQYFSMGGVDFAPDGHCAIASPEAVAATEKFLEALKVSGPREWPTQRWYELAMDFCDGKYGLIVDSDHYVGYYEKPVSKMAGRIGYAVPPANENGVATPNLWTWSVIMNAKSGEKEAAWRFMKWASSREFLLRAAFEGNMNPTRTSIWEDDCFRQFAANWGSFYEVSRRLVEQDGKVLVTPTEKYRVIAERWVKALLESYSSGNVKGELESAAKDIDNIIQDV